MSMLQHREAPLDGPQAPQMLDGFIAVVEQYLHDTANAGFASSLRGHLMELHEQRDRLAAVH